MIVRWVAGGVAPLHARQVQERMTVSFKFTWSTTRFLEWMASERDVALGEKQYLVLRFDGFDHESQGAAEIICQDFCPTEHAVFVDFVVCDLK